MFRPNKDSATLIAKISDDACLPYIHQPAHPTFYERVLIAHFENARYAGVFDNVEAGCYRFVLTKMRWFRKPIIDMIHLA